ncbi:14656_t:CDS:2, partial [Cetraspora pellucida]
LFEEECRQCYNEKTNPKKFSVENNMDPKEVPQELKNLTSIEEMLIAQVFPVISVYNLHRGQYTYCGNVINFSQDLQEFVTCLLHDSLSLDVLIVQHHSTNSPEFSDEILESLLENDEDNELNEDKLISQSFVSSILPGQKEDSTINSTLSRMQQGAADLHAHRIREALSERHVFIKQNLEERQLTIEEVIDLIQNDTHMADQVVRSELTDIIKQLGSKEMVFFTFSTADMQWPDLYKLMPNGECPIEEINQEAARC